MIDSGHRDVTGRIQHLLAESPIAEVRRIRVVQEGDRILLLGCVQTFYVKQMAQETIRAAVRGLRIVNSVNVDSDPNPPRRELTTARGESLVSPK